jgi:hypothetical protein
VKRNGFSSRVNSRWIAKAAPMLPHRSRFHFCPGVLANSTDGMDEAGVPSCFKTIHAPDWNFDVSASIPSSN